MSPQRISVSLQKRSPSCFVRGWSERHEFPFAKASKMKMVTVIFFVLSLSEPVKANFIVPQLSLQQYVFTTNISKTWHIYVVGFVHSSLQKLHKVYHHLSYFNFLMRKTTTFAETAGLSGGNVRWNNVTQSKNLSM